MNWSKNLLRCCWFFFFNVRWAGWSPCRTPTVHQKLECSSNQPYWGGGETENYVQSLLLLKKFGRSFHLLATVAVAARSTSFATSSSIFTFSSSQSTYARHGFHQPPLQHNAKKRTHSSSSWRRCKHTPLALTTAPFFELLPRLTSNFSANPSARLMAISLRMRFCRESGFGLDFRLLTPPEGTRVGVMVVCRGREARSACASPVEERFAARECSEGAINVLPRCVMSAEGNKKGGREQGEGGGG